MIIQFGHNDEKIKNEDRYTKPGSTFDANLKKFVAETREKGGTPILMNSIVRRNFPPTALPPLRPTTVRKPGKRVLKIIPPRGIPLWIPTVTTASPRAMSPRRWEWCLST